LADEQVIKLLEEIKDLQTQHLEKYKEALKNQQEAIEIQRRAVRRQKVTVFVISSLLIIFIAVLIWSSHP
jgi:t-SNARE complex subunit (syntaxin)